MKLEDYQKAWEQDGKIDKDELDVAATQVPLLHAKYWKFYSAERLALKKYNIEHRTLQQKKRLWLLGKMDDEQREALGWPVQQLRILEPAVQKYLDADADVQKLEANVAYIEEKLRFLEDIIKNINNRGYLIRTTVDFLKFKCGV